MSGTPLLSLAIWIPILAGFVVLATGSDRNAPLARMLSLIGAVAGLLVTIPLYTGFDMLTPAMQFVELKTWIPRFNVNYHLGVDGISMPFVILNSFITVTVILAGWQVIDQKVAQYNAGFLIMSGLLNGIFSALDGVLFYVFFEASLIPLYLIIGIWGGPNRVTRRSSSFSSPSSGRCSSCSRSCTCSSIRAAASRSSTGTSCRSV
jgi:NADH-quinone oxidoreductase subunit M